VEEDGLLDIFVGNDFGTHSLWRNKGGFAFEHHSTDIGLRDYGHTMGWGFGDFNADGALDVVMADAGPIELYIKDPSKLYYTDQAPAWGASIPLTHSANWAPLVYDFDQDGFEDLFLAVAGLAGPGDLVKLAVCGVIKQFPQQGGFFFRNESGQKFSACFVPDPANKTPNFAFMAQSAADLDDDGDLDILQAYRPGHLRALRNDIPNKGHRVGVILKGQPGNTLGIGARIVVKAGGKVYKRQAHGATGFGRSVLPKIHVGIGAATVAEEVTVHWPSGKTTVVTDVTADTAALAVEP
jgi:hypothetical protein